MDTTTNFSVKDILDKYTSIPQSVLDIESLGDTCTLAKPSQGRQKSCLSQKQNDETPTIIVSKLPREQPIPKKSRQPTIKEIPKYPLVTKNISKNPKETSQKPDTITVIKTTSKSVSETPQKHYEGIGGKNMYSGPQIRVIKTNERPQLPMRKIPQRIEDKNQIKKQDEKPEKQDEKPEKQQKQETLHKDESSISIDRLETILDLQASKGEGSTKKENSSIKDSIKSITTVNNPQKSKTKSKTKPISVISKISRTNKNSKGSKVNKPNKATPKNNVAKDDQNSKNKVNSKKGGGKKRKLNTKKVLSSIKTKPHSKAIILYRKKHQSITTSRPSRWEKKINNSKVSDKNNVNKTILSVYHLIPPQPKPVFTNNIKTKIDFLQQELGLTKSSNRPESLTNRLFEMVQDPLFTFES